MMTYRNCEFEDQTDERGKEIGGMLYGKRGIKRIE